MGRRRPVSSLPAVGTGTALDRTQWALLLLKELGLGPDSPQARETVALVRDNCRWDYAGERFFDGEVEPCINGRTVGIGAYFGEDVTGIVDRLLTEQMDDGGWNCEQENGSTRGSFPTRWFYDVLRALEYLRRAEVAPDERVQEAVGLIEAKRDGQGRWPLENTHRGGAHVHMELEGQPSRWNTLRAMRVLHWADRFP